MEKQRMEILLAAPTNKMRSINKIPQKKLFVSDMLQVNPIVDKRVIRNRDLKPVSSTKIPEVKSSTTATKYVNQKHENYQRLNRTNKLKQNEQWAELMRQNEEKLSNTKKLMTIKDVKSKNMDFLKKLEETNQDVDESEKQLKQISNYIQEKKKLMTKQQPSNASVNSRRTNNLMSDPAMKRITVKNVYSEQNDLENITKELEDELNKKTKKYEQKVRATQNRKKLNETLSTVDTKLNKIKDKYFNSDYETSHLSSIMARRPKYRTVKDVMKMENKTNVATMEATKQFQAEIEKDLNDLSCSTNLLNISDNQMKVLYENLDFIQKGTIPDSFSDVDHPEVDLSLQFDKTAPKTFFQSMTKPPKKTVAAVSPTTARKLHSRKPEQKSVSVGTREPDLNDLQESILKSDYLKKEFGIEPDTYVTPNSASRRQELLTLTKTQHAQWAKDLEYFLS